MADFREDLAGALLQRLMGEAKPRPELGQNQPVATMFGRVVNPGDTPQTTLARMPQGELETGGTLQEILKAGIPLGLWKGFNPISKASLTMQANKFPETFEAVLKSPEVLTYSVTKDLPKGAIGQAQTIGPHIQNVRIRPEYQESPDVIAHELGHFLSAGRIGKSSPADAETIGLLLGEQIINAGLKPSTLMNMASTGGVSSRFAGRPEALLRQASDIHPVMVDNLAQNLAPKTNLQHLDRYGVPGSNIDNWRRAFGEEGFAHLAQYTSQKGADPLLRLLAKRLGILPE